MPINNRDLNSVLKGFRAEKARDPIGAHKRAIAYLEGQIGNADSDADLASIYEAIAREHAIYRFIEDEERVRLEITKRFPDDPLSWIHASTFFNYEKANPNLALAMAREGSRAAIAAGRFVIHAYNEQCRAAKALCDYDTMTKVIMRILAYKHPPRSMDSAYECDFLIGLPAGAVSDDIADRLRDLCKRQK